MSLHVQLLQPEAPVPDGTLACVSFGVAAPESPRAPGPIHIHVPLQPLQPAMTEAWVSDRPLQKSNVDGVRYCSDGEVLFGLLERPDPASMEAGAVQAYERIEAFLGGCGYPHLLRIWNYFPRINEGKGDCERYRQFSLGRHHVLSRRADFEQRLCAATVIGTHAGGLMIYFLAAKESGIAVENPRQLSAYRYPPVHGPRSPSFARATLACGRLLVSGTASIVGHDTMHPHSPLDQLDETYENLLSLARHAVRQHGAGIDPQAPELLKVYLRDRSSWPAVQQRLQGLFGDTPRTVLLGDICRSDLSVEIEAQYAASST